jgi:hypothetical protein
VDRHIHAHRPDLGIVADQARREEPLPDPLNLETQRAEMSAPGAAAIKPISTGFLQLACHKSELSTNCEDLQSGVTHESSR